MVANNSDHNDGYISKVISRGSGDFPFRVLCHRAHELTTVNISGPAEEECVEHRIWIMGSGFTAKQWEASELPKQHVVLRSREVKSSLRKSRELSI